MERLKTKAGRLGEWQQLLEPLLANGAELAHLQASRDKLGALASQGATLNRQQAEHQARKQQVTRQLQDVFVDGDRLAALLRKALIEHYGARSEKLTEFGIQPYRGRPRSSPAPTDGGTPSPQNV